MSGQWPATCHALCKHFVDTVSSYTADKPTALILRAAHLTDKENAGPGRHAQGHTAGRWQRPDCDFRAQACSCPLDCPAVTVAGQLPRNPPGCLLPSTTCCPLCSSMTTGVSRCRTRAGDGRSGPQMPSGGPAWYRHTTSRACLLSGVSRAPTRCRGLAGAQSARQTVWRKVRAAETAGAGGVPGQLASLGPSHDQRWGRRHQSSRGQDHEGVNQTCAPEV